MAVPRAPGPAPGVRQRRSARRVDVELEQGEFVSLLGPSGCGKTTALRLVAGFDRPDAGSDRRRRQGHDADAAEQARHGHGVPGVRLFPNMTAARTSSSGCAIRGARPGDRGERVERAARARRPRARRRRGTRISSRAGCSSASRSRARSRSSRGCCSSTSRSRRSTRRCASSSARRSGGSSSSSGSRRST